jgi:glycosyltransferase involved in cell wall biosynthesis
MNVGVFLGDLTPEVGGGYTLQAEIFHSLVELAGKSKHTFVIFCNSRRTAEMKANIKSNRIKVALCPSPNLAERALSRALLEFTALRKLWRRPSRLERIAHKAGVEFMWFVGSTTAYVDLPCLRMVLDLQHRLQPWFPEVSGSWDEREVYFKRSLQCASVIITGTKAGQEEIERFYQVPPERIKILPHPTPGFALKAHLGDGKNVLDKYGIPKGYLFYPAQFWSHKNHANLLLSVQRLRDEYKLTLPVVFVGSDKGNEKYVRQLADKLGLSMQVHFLGFVPLEGLVSLYRNALALTYVTFFGPENLPPLEAFALGCPVVASKVAGAQEQLGEAALLVDPRSPEQIALAIKSIYDNLELRRTLVQRGFERASKWTGVDFIKGVFSILDEFEPLRRCWGG